MISRRAFLTAPVALAAAQSRRPDVLVVWTAQPSIPAALARECVIFPRAYAACPKPESVRRAIETGKFPHAFRPGDFQLPYRQLTASTNDDLVRMALNAPPGVIVVVTSPGDAAESFEESSIRVPLAIRYPGILIGRSAPEILISHADLMPTLLGLAGEGVPTGVQGRNLAPLLVKHQGDLPDSVYIQGKLRQPGEWRVVVRGYDKLVLEQRDQVAGLYNLADDPEERNDLSKEPAHRLTRDAMRALARTWMRRLSDGFDPSGARLR